MVSNTCEYIDRIFAVYGNMYLSVYLFIYLFIYLCVMGGGGGGCLFVCFNLCVLLSWML